MKIGIENDFWTAEYYEATVVSVVDYYPFGSSMAGRKYNQGSYRYGFNGMEKDDEVKGEGNSYDFGARIFDSRVGRWLAVDPLTGKAPNWTPYRFGFDNPIKFLDSDGRFEFDPETLAMLKEKYPTTYAYLVNTDINKAGNILELTKSDRIIKAMITNTDYYQAKSRQIKKLSLTGEQAYLLKYETAEERALTKADIVAAFSNSLENPKLGPSMIFVTHPGGLTDLDGTSLASGYNESHCGKCYNEINGENGPEEPIHINIGILEDIENAKTEEDKQNALITLTSVIIHEYMESFTDDNIYSIDGSVHGAYPAQFEIYGTTGDVPTLYPKGLGSADHTYPKAKEAKAVRGVGGSDPDPSVLPTLPDVETKKND